MKFLRSARRTADEMPFLDHLEELRWRLLWSLLALAVGAVVGLYLVVTFDVLGILVDPLLPFLDGGKPKFLSPADPFFISLKLAFIVGVILASPVVIYQTWAFVSPALHPHERKAIVPTLYMGLVLFSLGVALAYFIALPISLEFMMGFQTESLEQNIVIGAYMSLAVRLLLAFGIVFELPVVMMILAVLGVVDARMLASKRRFALVAITILSSVITPGDVVVLTVLMMFPLLLLYELSIGLCRLVERRRARTIAGPLRAGEAG